jgi:hypothetical protein
MAQSLARVDFSAKTTEFQRLALEPGRPMLDAGCIYATAVTRWLGRFAAVPEWKGETLDWHLQTDTGARIAATEVEAATSADLQQSLRAEFRSLQAKLEAADVRTTAEGVVHKLLLQQMRAASETDPGTQFVKYRDAQGRWRLAWCWGYQPLDRSFIPTAVCPACRNVFRLRPERNRTCPACRAALPVKRFPWGKVIAACLVMGIALAGAGAALWHFSPRGVITGTVVRAADDRPLAGVQIGPEGGSSATTDADGRFRIGRLPIGAIKLRAEMPGYERAETEVKLGAGEQQTVALKLSGAATITGTVVNGASQRPIADAEVAVVDGPWTTRSDDDGRFRLEGVPGGGVQLRAALSGFPQTVVEAQAGSDAPVDVTISLAGAARVVGQVFDKTGTRPIPGAKVAIAGAGLEAVTDEQGVFAFPQAPSGVVQIDIAAAGFRTERIEKDLVAQQERSLRVQLVGAASLTGRVLQAIDRQPRAGAKVTIAGTQIAAEVDAAGKFTIDGLPPGKVTVEATAPGFRTESAAVELSADAPATVDFALKGGAALDGRVLDAQTKQPLAFAEVTVRGVAVKFKTDEKGQFRIADLPSRPAQVEITRSGYKPASTESPLEDGKTAQIEVALVGDGVLRGLVLDALTALPIADAQIEAKALSARTRSGPDGRFELTGLRSGSVDIEVTAKDAEPARLTREIVSGKPSDVAVQLSGKLTLAGQVRHVLTGQPLADATVQLAGGKARAKTDAEGRFRFDKLRSGDVTVDVTAEGFRPRKLTAAVGESSPELQIVLGGPAVLTGRITDKLTGAGVAEADVSLANTKANVRTDAQGQYRLENLFGGPAEVVVAAAGYPDARAKVDVSPQNETSLKLDLSGTAEATGIAVDESDRPIANATVAIAGTSYKVTTDDEGQFRIQGCRSGRVALELSAAGFAAAPLAPTLKPGEAVSLGKVRLESALSLAGVVLSAATKQPVAGATVTVAGADRRAVSDAEGKFVVERVPHGEFAVRIAAQGYIGEEMSVAVGSDSAPRLWALCPELNPGQMRFVLTWTAPQANLNLHLFHTPPGGKMRHVSERAAEDGALRFEAASPDASGPETVAVGKLEPGRYELQVQAQAAEGAGDIAAAQPVLKIYRHGEKSPKLHRAKTSADARRPVWHACGVIVSEQGDVEVLEYARNAYRDALLAE